MNPIRFLTLTFYGLLFVLPAVGQDAITVGSLAGDAGTRVSVPVFVRDVSGTILGVDPGASAAIHALAFRIRISPPASVTDLAFERDGVAEPLVPLYERAVFATDSLAYIAGFSAPIPFTSNAPAPGDRVGTLRLTISPDLSAGTNITLSLDPATTALSNAGGTPTETVANSRLNLSSGLITVGGSPTALSLASSANPSMAGDAVTFAATVTSPTSGEIAGAVYFFIDGVERAVVQAVNGTASFKAKGLAAGTHSILASFEGGGIYQASAPTTIEQTVDPRIAAPEGVVATASAPTAVRVSWFPVADAKAYEILRREVLTGADTVVGTTSNTTFLDTGVAQNKTFLYSVRSMSYEDVRSAASAFDPATTVSFTDPILRGVRFKRVHVEELRTVVNEFRRAAGLSAYVFLQNPLPESAIVKRVHVEQLRSAINEASRQIELGDRSFASISGATPISAVHFEELRDALK